MDRQSRLRPRAAKSIKALAKRSPQQMITISCPPLLTRSQSVASCLEARSWVLSISASVASALAFYPVQAHLPSALPSPSLAHDDYDGTR